MLEYEFDLGAYSRPVSTSSADAQAWFDRGLVWSYGFNHEEAVRCFRRAAEADPDCAMAHWGIAYALGPNYNKDWVAFEPDELTEMVSAARAAVERAHALLGRATPVEQALIQALGARFPAATPPAECSVWSDAYAEAMRGAYRQFGDDPDVAALCAEALVGRTPWQLWDLQTGEPADGADTLEAIDVLERGMARSPEPHLGLLHIYLHTMEMSPFPERALPAADQLRGLAPDAGHLQHMPTHIDVLCGRYREVVTWNERAIEADRKYLAREGPLNFYTLYRCHDYHFKIYGALFLGQLEPALEAADEMAATLSDELLRIEVPPMADWAEGFVPMRLHVLVRFGRWQEIIDEPFPADRALYCTTTAMLHYAKGVAYASTGDAAARRGAAAAVPRGRRARARHPLPLQQHLPGRPRRRGRDARRRGRLPQRRPRQGLRAPAALGAAGRQPAVRRAVGMDAADPACARRTAAGAGARGGSGSRVPRRSRPRRHAQPAVPPSGQRLEPARLSRVPVATRQGR